MFVNINIEMKICQYLGVSDIINYHKVLCKDISHRFLQILELKIEYKVLECTAQCINIERKAIKDKMEFEYPVMVCSCLRALRSGLSWGSGIICGIENKHSSGECANCGQRYCEECSKRCDKCEGILCGECVKKYYDKILCIKCGEKYVTDSQEVNRIMRKHGFEELKF